MAWSEVSGSTYWQPRQKCDKCDKCLGVILSHLDATAPGHGGGLHDPPPLPSLSLPHLGHCNALEIKRELNGRIFIDFSPFWAVWCPQEDRKSGVRNQTGNEDVRKLRRKCFYLCFAMFKHQSVIVFPKSVFSANIECSWKLQKYFSTKYKIRMKQTANYFTRMNFSYLGND